MPRNKVPKEEVPVRRKVIAPVVSPQASKQFVEDIRGILLQARHKAYAASNFAMVEAYWQAGRRIVVEEQGGRERADYGAFLMKELSKRLAGDFGNGVSIANLWNFRQFYLAFSDEVKLYALRRELSWTHYRLIMRITDSAAREYYIQEAADQAWGSRQLERNIASMYYERLLVKPKTKLKTSAGARKAGHKGELHPGEFVKDPMVLEFLGLSESPRDHESKLEAAIVGRLQQFLLELGKGFSFVGRQFRVSSETRHYYIDLVFYNYLLKCFVLIDLKTTKLSHQDIGQLDMYVRMFDDLKRGTDDNPTLGIILCADKDDTEVRYSVLDDNPQLFASKYRLVLPSEDELRRALQRQHVLDWDAANSDED